jgi:CheY-like chemotaxis protein
VGGVIGLVGMSVEVTDRKRIEERMRQSQRIEAVGRLTAGVAHDFNNVLQALLGGIELAIDELADQPDIRGDLDLALRAGKRGARLTSHLLSFSRQQVLRPTPVAPGPLLAELSHILLRTLGRDIAVSVVVAPGLPPVLADAAHLDSALLNLALNARDAMPRGGALTITATAAHDRVTIAVVDTGDGMSAEVLAQACEPFFTTKGLKGSGLGLSMVQGFARQSGGELNISSVPGHGTRIDITLPVAVGYAPGGPAEASPGMHGAGRVLVVDDEPDVLRVTTSFLRKKGFEVTAAADATAALAVLADGPAFDLLVADHALPGMTGADLVMAARSEYRGLPALIITGHAVVDELERLPPDVIILRKPFERDELVRTAKSLIDAAPWTAPAG